MFLMQTKFFFTMNDGNKIEFQSDGGLECMDVSSSDEGRTVLVTFSGVAHARLHTGSCRIYRLSDTIHIVT